jgi:NAD(P)-dependent dehydrogenase (short-subunit alcohol dehydrogenase family)
MKTLAIFGAGPGLGVAAARRFGKEGFQVTLVSRNGERLQSFVDELAADGVRAVPLAADLADLAGHDDLIARIGPVDVALINGFLDEASIRPVGDIDVDSMRAALEGVVLAPLSLTRLLLPGMLERGDGALLYGLGASARNPLPPLAGAGSAQAGLRNYALALNAELARKGVYAGVLTIGALIERSDAQRTFDSDSAAQRGFQPERIDPDELAEFLWTQYIRREPVEQTVGALAA